MMPNKSGAHCLHVNYRIEWARSLHQPPTYHPKTKPPTNNKKQKKTRGSNK